MNLTEVQLGSTYEVISIKSNDDELDGFLLTLGCYKGAKITVISKVGKSYIVSLKDGRYNIDKNLAEVIEVMKIG